MKNHYQTLGVHRQSKPDDIKVAWRNIAFLLHPDRPKGDAERFKEASEANNVLRDRHQRALYDKSLEFLGKPCSACRGAGFRPDGRSFAAITQTACKKCGGCGYVDFVAI